MQTLEVRDYPDLVELINCTFQANEDLASFLAENHSVFSKQNPNFKLNIELEKSIENILSFYKKTDEFKHDNHTQIEAKIFDFTLPQKFKQLGETAKELAEQHVMAFRVKANISDLVKALPKEDQNIAEEKICKEVYSSLMAEYTVLNQIGYALEFYAKKEEQTKDFKIAEQKYWITKDDKGNYLFDGGLVYIPNTTTPYFVIFDLTFLLKPEGGVIKYEDIVSEGKKRKLKLDRKKIQRALCGNNANLFRYVRGIPQSPARGIDLFKAKQDGKYLEFNNKK